MKYKSDLGIPLVILGISLIDFFIICPLVYSKIVTINKKLLKETINSDDVNYSSKILNQKSTLNITFRKHTNPIYNKFMVKLINIIDYYFNKSKKWLKNILEIMIVEVAILGLFLFLWFYDFTIQKNGIIFIIFIVVLSIISSLIVIINGFLWYYNFIGLQIKKNAIKGFKNYKKKMHKW